MGHSQQAIIVPRTIQAYVFILFNKSEARALKAEGLLPYVSEQTDRSTRRDLHFTDSQKSPRFPAEVWPSCRCLYGGGWARESLLQLHLVLAGRRISGQKDTDSIKHRQAQGNAFCDKHIKLPLPSAQLCMVSHNSGRGPGNSSFRQFQRLLAKKLREL